MQTAEQPEIQATPQALAEAETRSPMPPALQPMAEMEQALERLVGQNLSLVRGWTRPLEWKSAWWGDFFDFQQSRMPKADVAVRDDDVVVRAEVPGVDKSGLELSLRGRRLTITGEVQRQEEGEEGIYHWREIGRSGFSRTLTLPADVDPSRVAAVLKNGILEISLPKLDISRPHSIAVSEAP